MHERGLHAHALLAGLSLVLLVLLCLPRGLLGRRIEKAVRRPRRGEPDLLWAAGASLVVMTVCSAACAWRTVLRACGSPLSAKTLSVATASGPASTRSPLPTSGRRSASSSSAESSKAVPGRSGRRRGGGRDPHRLRRRARGGRAAQGILPGGRSPRAPWSRGSRHRPALLRNAGPRAIRARPGRRPCALSPPTRRGADCRLVARGSRREGRGGRARPFGFRHRPRAAARGASRARRRARSGSARHAGQRGCRIGGGRVRSAGSGGGDRHRSRRGHRLRRGRAALGGRAWARPACSYSEARA